MISLGFFPVRKILFNRSRCNMQPQKSVCVVGGAGYIGSHMVTLLKSKGYTVVVFDDLSNGHAEAIKDVELFQGSILDREALTEFFSQYDFECVFHFASLIQVGESVSNPSLYYQNNVVGSINLLDCMIARGIKKIIFSSTAAIFGSPLRSPIDEDHPKSPLSPYGKTKLFVEETLKDYDTAYGLKSISLRYFNAAGAAPDGMLGERHNPETHLIPLVLQHASNRQESFSIFGDDYSTPDGTCIRDYIHVADLCDAHLLALKFLEVNNRSEAFNLGTGVGHSVAEIIDIAQTISEKSFDITVLSRRPGDPSVLIADGTKARKILGWDPKWGIEEIIAHAWGWEKKFPWQ